MITAITQGVGHPQYFSGCSKLVTRSPTAPEIGLKHRIRMKVIGITCKRQATDILQEKGNRHAGTTATKFA